MQAKNLAFVIEQATDTSRRDPVRVAARHSIEVGVVVPSILRDQLDKAGLTLVDDTAALADYGFASLKSLKRVIVRNGDDIVAMGAAGDSDEALLHAMLGYFREHAAPGEDVPAGIAEAPTQPA